MKKFVFLLIVVVFVSCSLPSTPSESEATDVIESIRYDRDPRTGLCFAIVQSQHDEYLVNSIACVPCDSLKHLEKVGKIP